VTNSIYRRAALRGSLAGAAALAAPVVVRAQEPLDTAKILIGFPPGGSSDVAARHLADKLTPSYARNVIVDNRPGAAGRIAIDALKSAAPDGRTLLLTPASTVTIYAAVLQEALLQSDDRSDAGVAGLHFRAWLRRRPRGAGRGQEPGAIRRLGEGQSGQVELRQSG
jgi:hypothetical protein